MAEKPYRVIDRRGQNSGLRYPAGITGTVPGFAESAKTSRQRQAFINYDKDALSLFPREDRKALMTIGRALFQNSSIVQAALNQMSSMATSIVTPQFDGEDKEWGMAAEAWLYENDKWIDVRGWPYCMSDMDRLKVLHIIRDGDVGELLTKDAQGNPKVQLIPAHRIGSRTGPIIVTEGKFAGANLIDGVFVNDSLEVLGYQVLGDTEQTDRPFSINDMRLHFRPFYSDQIRGVSWLGAAAIDVQDVKEFRRLELIAQKVISGRTIIEHNETGMPDGGVGMIINEGVEAAASSNGEALAPVYGREINGGETTYFRAGSNSKLEVLSTDRPSANQQAFSEDTVRQGIHGIGWSVDYALNPGKVGGASMRVVVETINDTLDMIRQRITAPSRRWVDGWRISKAVNAGWLPFNADWWKWEYQFAQRKTADKKYDSDVDVNEFRAGFSTLRDVCARRGEWYQDVIAQKSQELEMLMEQAKAIASKFGVPLEYALDRLSLTVPNGSQVQQQAQPAQEANQ